MIDISHVHIRVSHKKHQRWKIEAAKRDSNLNALIEEAMDQLLSRK